MRSPGAVGSPAGAPAPTALAEAVASRVGAAAHVGAPLGALTTYRVGGPAAVLVEVGSEDDLLELRRVLAEVGAAGRLPVLVIGKGSNMLVADRGFPGLAVRLGGRLSDIHIAHEVPEDGAGDAGRPGESAPVTVRAGGGADLPKLARRTVNEGLRGLEWAVGIPGTVGGALAMNAGGHGSDTASCLVRFRTVDLTGAGVVEDGPERLGLGYRSSNLGPSEVVVWADFSVLPGNKAEGQAALSEIVRWRRENQPGGSNAGSVFTNPPGDSAGRLVESCGLKGYRLGSARVSVKHANFIQADDGGSADDVRALMAHVARAVADATGVELHPEVKLVGFPDGARGNGWGDGLGAGDGARGEKGDAG